MFRRLIALCGVAALLIVGLATPAAAETISPSELGSRCASASGPILLTDDLVVKEGTGQIPSSCTIIVPAGSKFVMKNMTLLQGSGCGSPCQFSVSGGADSTIKILNSSVNIDWIRLAAGADGQPNGLVKVKDSTLNTSGTQLAASPAGSNGRVVVRNSKIYDFNTVGLAGPAGISLGATSTHGGAMIKPSMNGQVIVTDTVLSTPRWLVAATLPGPDSATKIKRSNIDVANAIVTGGAGGSCVLRGNTVINPAGLACS